MILSTTSQPLSWNTHARMAEASRTAFMLATIAGSIQQGAVCLAFLHEIVDRTARQDLARRNTSTNAPSHRLGSVDHDLPLSVDSRTELCTFVHARLLSHLNRR
jgi:hypothetical protein